MAVGDVYEVTISGRVNGEYCENIIHLREVVGATAPIPASEVCDSALLSWAADLAPLLATSFTKLQCIYARRIHPTPGVAFTKLIALDGEEGTDPVPAGTGLVVSWATALGGRSKRGRSYIFGIPETFQNGGNITEPCLTAFNAWVASVMAAWGPTGASDYRLCVWSALLSTSEDVVAGIVRTNLGSMRSRRQRPGTAT